MLVDLSASNNEPLKSQQDKNHTNSTNAVIATANKNRIKFLVLIHVFEVICLFLS